MAKRAVDCYDILYKGILYKDRTTYMKEFAMVAFFSYVNNGVLLFTTPNGKILQLLEMDLFNISYGGHSELHCFLTRSRSPFSSQQNLRSATSIHQVTSVGLNWSVFSDFQLSFNRVKTYLGDISKTFLETTVKLSCHPPTRPNTTSKPYHNTFN